MCTKLYLLLASFMIITNCFGHHRDIKSHQNIVSEIKRLRSFLPNIVIGQFGKYRNGISREMWHEFKKLKCKNSRT